MGHLLDDVSHLGHEAFDLGDRPGGKCEELFAQRHDASAQRFFQGDFQTQVADAGDRQILGGTIRCQFIIIASLASSR